MFDLKTFLFVSPDNFVFIPIHHIVTLDDDFMSMRSSDNLVKPLLIRKADKEGQVTDVIAGALI